MAMTLQILALLLVPGAGEDKMQLVQGTSGSRSDALEIHSGGLVVREGSAGVIFGTVRAGKGKRHLSYFVVFKHRLRSEGKSDSSEEATAENSDGESKQSLTIDNQTLHVEYKVKLDADRKVRRETLTINGKSADPAKGRVFTVDLTVSPPKWEQHKLPLPAEVGEATSKKAAEDLARKVLATLAKEDRTVKAFVAAAAK
jgi:hypothetical protein